MDFRCNRTAESKMQLSRSVHQLRSPFVNSRKPRLGGPIRIVGNSAAFSRAACVLFGKGALPTWTSRLMSDLRKKLTSIKPGVPNGFCGHAAPLLDDFSPSGTTGRILPPASRPRDVIGKLLLVQDHNGAVSRPASTKRLRSEARRAV